MTNKQSATTAKKGLHPRNPHRDRYDFDALIKSCPALATFVAENRFGDRSVDFNNPEAVKTLNRALLSHYYQVQFWDIPAGFLCPPIPGRADYIHHLADLLASSNEGVVPTGKQVRGLDIGAGANCVYPIVGHRAYGWRFVASDIDPISVKFAKFIADSNPSLVGNIQCRLQKNPDHIFTGMINRDDVFDFTVCNPPFHASLEEAMAGNERKVKNLAVNAQKKNAFIKPGKGKGAQRPDQQALAADKQASSALNFGGQKAELWCPGGEVAFIRRMIKQSVDFAGQCLWFTTLVSKKENLPAIYNQLKQVGAVEVKTVDMAQGQKQTRIVAWSFLSQEQHAEWREDRWFK